MTPFDPNLPPNADQPLDQDDLIAFHLHELPRAQVRAVNRTLRNNPQLQAESIAIATTLRAFSKHEPSLPLDAAALDRHWQTLQSSLPPHTPTPHRPLRKWTLPVLAGTALATILLLVSQYHHRPAQPSEIAITTARIAASTAPSEAALTLQPPQPSTSGATLYSNSTFRLSTPNASAPNHARPTLFAPMQLETLQTSLNVHIPEPFTASPPAEPSTSTAAITSATAPSSLASNTSLPKSIQSTESARNDRSPARPYTQTSRGFTHANTSTDISLSGFGAFTNSATPGNSNFYRMNPAASAGGLLEVRHISKPYLGWEASYSFRRANEVYDELIEGTPVACGSAVCPVPTYAVSATSQEFTADWVTSGKIGSFRPFVLLGAGLLLTRPAGGQSGTSTTHQAAFDYGAGVDWELARHFGLHLQYRGALYKAPGIVPPNNTSPNIGFMHTSDPAIGVYYRF